MYITSGCVISRLGPVLEEQGCNVGTHGLSVVFPDLHLLEVVHNIKNPKMNNNWSIYLLNTFSISNTYIASNTFFLN